MQSTDGPLYIGIDFGTSGCRAVAIDAQSVICAQSQRPIPSPHEQNNQILQNPEIWWHVCRDVLFDLLKQINPAAVARICVDGTSATTLLCDHNGTLLTEALMYNDASSIDAALQISVVAPPESGAHGRTSSLAKALTLIGNFRGDNNFVVAHQADWIAGKLSQHFGYSDENNALKLGYNPVTRSWPKWLLKLDPGLQPALPQIHAPGDVISKIDKQVAADFSLPDTVEICAGTTDSIAALIACGVSQTGDAVTSLGTTMAIKIISDKPVFAPEFGIYSHRLHNIWLAGGASNVGGGALLKIFDTKQLKDMTTLLNPDKPTGLRYYPLTKTGERFPVNDPNKKPELEPRPSSDLIYFQALLESMAEIEKQAYGLLHALGAPYPTRVLSAGGGSKNKAWNKIRQRYLDVPVYTAAHTEAAYGAALLAKGIRYE